MNPLPPLHQWPNTYRKLIGVFSLVTLLGFLSGFAYLALNTSLTPKGIITHYNGLSEEEMESAGELKFAKSARELLVTTHNHILGLSVLFLGIGFLYLHTGAVSRLRLAIAIEPFLSLVMTFGGIWLVRFVWTPFILLVILSGVLMIGCYAWMALAILRSCFFTPRNS